MISVEIARTGHPVLKKGDRFLASSFDPEREAKNWAAKLVVRPSQTVIVLGLGSGYHVVSLLDQRPNSRVLVIENDAEIVHQTANFLPRLRGAEVLVETDWTKLVNYPAFCDAVGGSYAIAPYGASLQIEPTFFNAVNALLLGRDKLSFLLLLKSRPEFHGLLSPEAISALADHSIGIKEVVRLFSPQASGHHERRLWRVLEELVA